MRWAEITIKTTEEASDAICEMLAQVGADGIASQDPMEFRNTIDNDPLSYCDDGTIESYGEDVVIKAYFAETDDGVIRMGPKSEEFVNPEGVGMIYGSITDKSLKTDEAMDYIKQRLDAIGEFLDVGKGFDSYKYVDDEDWANNWKRYYQEFKLSDRIVICPSWIEEGDEELEKDAIKIILDPGSAFGTGTHETTSMCAEILDRVIKPDTSVLDLGTGSGILAIIASKLGAKSVDAVDIDSMAVRVAEENTAINSCSNIDCYTGELKSVKNAPYDLIVANIIADVIAEIACDIPADLADDGIFVCSGIIANKKDRVIEALKKAGMEIIAEQSKNDWMAYVAKKA
ncbi:MAG: 50S ribosomal protein L11 methyltransferase [Saccharofermentans sp.]|nr:50S ribosomal protein L11 methyltransferase [Saccharofermentans sp.]